MNQQLASPAIGEWSDSNDCTQISKNIFLIE